MYPFYISKYTKNDKTHDSTSWYLYPTSDTTNVNSSVLKLENSTESLNVWLADYPIPDNSTYYVVAFRNMSDGTKIEIKTSSVEKVSTDSLVTTLTTDGVETPIIKVVSNDLDSFGKLELTSSLIRPKGNVLSHTVWVVKDQDNDILKVSFDSPDYSFYIRRTETLTKSTLLKVYCAHVDVDNVISKFAYKEVQVYTIALEVSNAVIDPMLTFSPIFKANSLQPVVRRTRVLDGDGRVVHDTEDSNIPAGTLQYDKTYRVIFTLNVNNVNGIVIKEFDLSTLKRDDLFVIDSNREYVGISSLPSNVIFSGLNITEEALFGVILLPQADGNAIIANVSTGDTFYVTDMGLNNAIDFTKLYTVRVFSPTKLAVIYHSATELRCAVFTHTTSMSNLAKLYEYTLASGLSKTAIVSSSDRVYYIGDNGSKFIASVAIDGTDHTIELLLPTNLNIGDTLYLDVIENKIYIFGDTDALLEFDIGARRLDRRQRNMEAVRSRTYLSTILANRGLLYISTDSDLGYVYDNLNDSFETINTHTSNKRGLIRMLDGSIRIYDDVVTDNKVYK